MRNGFFKGMITGIIVSALVCLGVFFLTDFVDHNILMSGRGNIGEIDGQYVSLKDIVTSDEFIGKCDVLNSYIDAYYLNKNDINAKDISDGMYQGIIDSIGDKYADYYNEEEYTSFMESAKGQYGGIGTYVTQNVKTGDIVIVNPFEGAPADKAGIKSGDILTEIDGKSVIGLELDDIVAMMKGEAGTSVTIGIQRDGNNLTVEVVREIVDVPTVSFEVLEDSNVGYIYISSFDEVTGKQFRNAVDELVAKNVDGLIIDLRNNGGGLIDAVVDTLDRILPEGLIMYTENNKGRDEEYFSSAEESYDKPYAVLINEYSA
ncbi:MAG: PDZ domain-containing protein, partial [Lachnospiraceae bacterium]|nr:PDZ domain-containing protein [Lachnospiraceae bacterium]